MFFLVGRAVAGAPATDRARAATMPMEASFTCFVLFFGGERCGFGAAACTADERADSVDRREADEAVDDAGDCVRLAELEAEGPGDEVELRDREGSN